MEIPLWIGGVVVAIVVGVVATILIRAYVLRQRMEAKWQADTIKDSRVPWGITLHIDPGSGHGVDEVVGWCNRAIALLASLGPWTSVQLSTALAGASVIIHPVNTWVDNWQRNVAGLTWVDSSIIEIGADGAALCHEFAELAYTAIESNRPECWHAKQWDGRSKVEAAVAAYIAGMLI